MKAIKWLRVLVIILIVMLAAALTGSGLYLKQQKESTVYLGSTTINGLDVSGKTPAEVYDELTAEYMNASVDVREKGEDSISGKLADFGYVIVTEQLMDDLNHAYDLQRSDYMTVLQSLMDGTEYQVTVPFVFSEEVLDAKVSAETLKEARFGSTDAEISYDDETKTYSIIPEVYGNELSSTELQNLVKTNLTSYIMNGAKTEEVAIDIPDTMYVKPQVTSKDKDLTDQVSVYNSFSQAKITHVFGSEKVTIDWNTIKNWVSVSEEGEPVLDAEQIYEYIIKLASKYNTRHYDRLFHTSIGTVVTIPSNLNEYGYTIDEEGEYEQILTDLYNNTAVEREPVYVLTNSSYGNPVFYRREGTDDLAGTYVEANLTIQHLWFYRDGVLIVDCDIVSGNVSKGDRETQTGAFPLAYKESPSILTGGNGADAYSTEVQYWMPFYEGQGLHDAWWQSSFGGSVYEYAGSRGCINLPPYAAEIIYNNIEAGMAIIIYK